MSNSGALRELMIDITYRSNTKALKDIDKVFDAIKKSSTTFRSTIGVVNKEITGVGVAGKKAMADINRGMIRFGNSSKKNFSETNKEINKISIGLDKVSLGLDKVKRSAKQASGVDGVQGLINKFNKLRYLYGIVGGASVFYAKSTADTIKDYGVFATRLGTNIEYLSAFKNAVGISGLQVQEFDGALIEYEKATKNAINGNKSLITTFQNLGLSTDTLKITNTIDSFEHVLKTISTISDKAKKEEILDGLFGKYSSQMKLKSGTVIREILDNLDLVKENYKEVVREGLYYGESMENASRTFLTSFKKTATYLEIIKNKIILGALPSLTALTDKMNAFFRSASSNDFQYITLSMNSFGESVKNALGEFGNLLVQLGRGVNSVLKFADSIVGLDNILKAAAMYKGFDMLIKRFVMVGKVATRTAALARGAMTFGASLVAEDLYDWYKGNDSVSGDIYKKSKDFLGSYTGSDSKIDYASNFKGKSDRNTNELNANTTINFHPNITINGLQGDGTYNTEIKNTLRDLLLPEVKKTVEDSIESSLESVFNKSLFSYQ